MDSFQLIQKNKVAIGLKNVTRAEEALIDEYPCFPVLQSSLMLEMMAQVGGVLVGASIDFRREVVLAKIANAEFEAAVGTPSALKIEARLVELGEDAAMTSCEITREGKRVARSEIFFGLFERLGDDGKRSMVFSEDFMESYNIRRLIQDSKGAAC
ncbi:MAG: hypothetical protein HQL11_02440 [Candidatus Omnitrophica bacterium]|nr:hypothetical protein [Candidatus Omnitrophota bacterium]